MNSTISFDWKFNQCKQTKFTRPMTTCIHLPTTKMSASLQMQSNELALFDFEHYSIDDASTRNVCCPAYLCCGCFCCCMLFMIRLSCLKLSLVHHSPFSILHVHWIFPTFLSLHMCCVRIVIFGPFSSSADTPRNKYIFTAQKNVLLNKGNR